MKAEKIKQRHTDEEMLSQFLTKWPIESLFKMSLRNYNHTGDKETFCQWVETKTRPLGSIKGNNSTKFGIYRRLNNEKKPKHTVSNKEYTWKPKFNDEDLDEQKAFGDVIKEIQQIANFAMSGDFASIENMRLNSLFRWKVAYLYSENRLIPVFAKTSLLAIVNRQGMGANYRTDYHRMQEFLMARKPFNMTVVEYMRVLFDDLRDKSQPKIYKSRNNRGRRSIVSKLGGQQARSGHDGYTANLFHDDIQQALYRQLCDWYSQKNVFMELDWVDIMVELPAKIIMYEIKSDRYPIDCMLKGIGQLLGYAYLAKIKYNKPIELVIAGPNKHFESDQEILNFLIDQISIPISYMKINY